MKWLKVKLGKMNHEIICHLDVPAKARKMLKFVSASEEHVYWILITLEVGIQKKKKKSHIYTKL